jgi:hypothetical protein
VASISISFTPKFLRSSLSRLILYALFPALTFGPKAGGPTIPAGSFIILDISGPLFTLFGGLLIEGLGVDPRQAIGY